MTEAINIRPISEKDSERVTEIYNHYIRSTTATFEEDEITVAAINQRIEKVHSAGLPWLVITVDEQVMGFAYAGQWHNRSAYRFSVETTIYLDHTRHGKGFGVRLYKALLDQLKPLGIKTAIGCVTLPNKASAALHNKIGMEQVAHFKKVGFKFDQWLDVGYWQCMLE